MIIPPTLPELLAPAGQPDAGYAALHYGADAVYLGLDRFSARAEAVNFTPDGLGEFAAYAHTLKPRRSVYLALNTLVQDGELGDAADTLLVAAECGVDAVIVQDLGVARLVRERFPSLELHASTQMAVHNVEGALAAADLGCSRVTLARELTLAEVRRVAEAARERNMEVEVFVHGTLCYSYSGVCLFSSIISGRSGNRGRCVYSCREAAETPAGHAHPFSLKDMALGERVLDLARAGVASLKIEGRKKSPLYVGATVDYYRRILDGNPTPRDREALEDRLKTIFARPWTRLFIDGRRNPEAADPEVVGHRGAPLGVIARLARTPSGPGIVFRTRLALERHDGIQVDIPGEAKPYGFPVDNLYLATGRGKGFESAFEVPAGTDAAVGLPFDAPPLAPGFPVYQSSSQAVKRAYPFHRPKAGAFVPGHPLTLEIRIAAMTPDAAGDAPARARVACKATAILPNLLRRSAGGDGTEQTDGVEIAAFLETEESAFPARNADGAEKAARTSFERTGESRFRIAGWRFENADALYLRPGDWNRIRRELLGLLETERQKAGQRDREALAATLAAPPASAAKEQLNDNVEQWALFTDSFRNLDAFRDEDFTACDELIVEIAGDPRTCREELARLEDRIGRDRLRLATPLILRDGGETARLVETLKRDGRRRWLATNLWGWQVLSEGGDCDVAADWALYAMNRLAVTQLRDMGFSAITLSPEDDADNLAALAAYCAGTAWIVAYSDLPLFISAACAHSHLGLCPATGNRASRGCAGTEPLRIVMERSGPAIVYPTVCGSVVVGEKPFSALTCKARLLAAGHRRFRCDLRWRRHDARDAVALWRKVKTGEEVDATPGNLERGLK